MGKSITCTMEIQISISNTSSEYISGAMSFKDAFKIGKSNASAFNGELVKITCWPQTSKGRNLIRKDFAIIDCSGKVDRYNVGDPIPFYAF